jgi:hypothetical protein
MIPRIVPMRNPPRLVATRAYTAIAEAMMP